MKATKTIVVISAACVLAIVAGEFYCKKPAPYSPYLDKKQAEYIEKLEARLRAIPKTNIHDTVRVVRTQYRLRIDTLFERLAADTSWSNVCRLTTGGPPSYECKSILLSSYWQVKRDSIVIGIYENARQIDSTRITILTALDSIKTERISNLSSHIEKMQEKADKRQKRAKIGHVAGIIGTLILIFK